MTSLRSKLAIFAIIGCTVLGSVIMTGCATSPAGKIAQAAKVTITVVNDGMTEWANYVNAGKAKKSQIDKVNTAYTAYYVAMQALRAVADKLAVAENQATVGVAPTQADIDMANAHVTQTEANLLAILNSILR